MQRLQTSDESEVLFVNGCDENMVKFYHQFDHVVLLTVPVPIIVERLVKRTNNQGKRPEEVNRVLEHVVVEKVLELLELRARNAADSRVTFQQLLNVAIP